MSCCGSCCDESCCDGVVIVVVVFCVICVVVVIVLCDDVGRDYSSVARSTDGGTPSLSSTALVSITDNVS